MNEIEELIKTYEKDIANLTKSMGLSSPLNETRKRELLACLEFGVSALRKVKREPVEVPYCFEVDYERHSHLKYNKSEMLLTAMGGIYRTAFQNQFKELHKDTFKTGIKWNCWSPETILWASRNYKDFCKAVITGNYTVAKEPLYWAVIGVTDYFRCDGKIIVFTKEEEAIEVANLIGISTRVEQLNKYDYSDCILIDELRETLEEETK